MICEICGQTILGQPRKIIVEKARLLVCEDCAKHGSETWEFEKPRPAAYRVKAAKTMATTGKPQKKIDEEYSLVADYGIKIRSEREKRSWTQEELASRLNMKASFISKVEVGKVVPTVALTQKMEHLLGIELISKEEPPKVKVSPPKPESSGLTIGDIVSSIERAKKGVKTTESSPS